MLFIHMMNSTMKQVHVEFELPSLLASQAGLDLNNISQHVRLLVALFLYEHQRISLGKACELGGISQWEFAELNRQFAIPVHYSPEDLTEDMEKLAHA